MSTAWLLAGAVLVGLFLIARKAQPAANQQGGTIPAKDLTVSETNTLKVASFNIQTGKSLQGKRDINRSAQLIRENHLVGVQEVYAPTWLNHFGFGLDQTSALSAGTRFTALFNATRRRWFREHRGNALLTQLTIHRWQSTMLPDRSGKSYRNMTRATVEWQNQQFEFFNTHLHTRDGREEQLKIVLDAFDQCPCAILVGDFNSRANTPLLAELLRASNVTDAIAAAGLDLANKDRIDWIFTKGFKVVGGKMIEKGISDHPYYQVELAFSG